MKSIKRIVGLVTIIGFLLAYSPPDAHAFGFKTTGKPKSVVKKERKAKNDVDGEKLTAEVMLDDGPADAICVSRQGDPNAPAPVWEEPGEDDVEETYVWRDIPGSTPPRQERVLVSRKVIRRWKVLTLTCNGTERSVRVCVPEPGQPKTVCPPVKKPDGRSVALHIIDYASWRDLNPEFAPNLDSEGVGSFAVTQAPLFFWFSSDDWAYHPKASAQACNAAGCLTALTIAVPVAVGLSPGVSGVHIQCEQNGTPITSPTAYEEARAAKACHQYTYRHSSTTTAGKVYNASVNMDYQIFIAAVDEDDIDNSINFGPDPGNIWESTVEFDVKVGEIEGVIK
jgi:hypothetical protein